MRNKYNARKQECAHGHTHDSIKEAFRCDELYLLQRDGEIKQLAQQPEFNLIPPFKYQGKSHRALKYRADFSYFDVKNDRYVVEDVKGFKTNIYKLKKKMLLYLFSETNSELVFYET